MRIIHGQKLVETTNQKGNPEKPKKPNLIPKYGRWPKNLRKDGEPEPNAMNIKEIKQTANYKQRRGLCIEFERNNFGLHRNKDQRDEEEQGWKMSINTANQRAICIIQDNKQSDDRISRQMMRKTSMAKVKPNKSTKAGDQDQSF